MIRDSSGYIVNHEGKIRFSENNFTDVLDTKIETHENETLYRIDVKMKKVDHKVTVPADTFDVVNCQDTVISHSSKIHVENRNFIDTYYAQGIGKILYTHYYLNGTDRYESRLVRYFVKSLE